MGKKVWLVVASALLMGVHAKTVEDAYGYAIGAYGAHTSYGLQQLPVAK